MIISQPARAGQAPLAAGRLDSLPRQEAVDGLPVHTKDAADANGVQTAVVDQPPDRLGMNAELTRDLAHGVQSLRLGVDG